MACASRARPQTAGARPSASGVLLAREGGVGALAGEPGADIFADLLDGPLALRPSSFAPRGEGVSRTVPGRFRIVRPSPPRRPARPRSAGRVRTSAPDIIAHGQASGRRPVPSRAQRVTTPVGGSPSRRRPTTAPAELPIDAATGEPVRASRTRERVPVVPIRHHAEHTARLCDLYGLDEADVPQDTPRPHLYTDDEPEEAALLDAPDAGPLAPMRVREALRRTELFAGVDERALDVLIARSSVRTAPRYHMVYRRGAPAKGQPVYVWLSEAGGTGVVELGGMATDAAERAAAAIKKAADGSTHGVHMLSRPRKKRTDAHDRSAEPGGADTSDDEGADGNRAATPPKKKAEPAAAVAFGAEGCARDADVRLRFETALVQAGPVTLLMLQPRSLPEAVVKRATAMANTQLLQRLRGPNLFADLPPASLTALTSQMRLRCLEPGELLTREGEEVPHLLTLVQGSVRSWTGGEEARGGAGGAGRRRGAALKRGSSSGGSIGRLGAQPLTEPSAPIFLDAASDSACMHCSLEGLAHWLTSGDDARARMGATYAAETRAWVLACPSTGYGLLLQEVPGLVGRVDAMMRTLDKQRDVASAEAARVAELSAMRAQCKHAQWIVHGAPIETKIALLRRVGQPAFDPEDEHAVELHAAAGGHPSPGAAAAARRNSREPPSTATRLAWMTLEAELGEPDAKPVPEDDSSNSGSFSSHRILRHQPSLVKRSLVPEQPQLPEPRITRDSSFARGILNRKAVG